MTDINDRTHFVVFHVSKRQLRLIRTLVHAQPWYDGADIPIGPRDFVVHGSNVPTKAIYDDLAHLFDQVRIHFKKRSTR